MTCHTGMQQVMQCDAVRLFADARRVLGTWPKLPTPRTQSLPSGLLQTVISAGSRSQGCAVPPSDPSPCPMTGTEVSIMRDEELLVLPLCWSSLALAKPGCEPVLGGTQGIGWTTAASLACRRQRHLLGLILTK